MDFAFTAEQQELRETARAFLEEHASSARVRAAMETRSGWDDALWKQLGAELGWTAVHIPEAHGGLGLGFVELIALQELMGERLVCSPYFATIALGANALLVAGSEAQQQQYLPRIAQGELTATLAHGEPHGRPQVDAVETTCEADAGGYVLRGTKRFVVDGGTAELLIVPARAPGTQGEEGIALFAVPAETPGVEREILPTVDPTRRQGEIRLHDVRVDAGARMAPAPEGRAGAQALSRILDLAAIALAAEQVGGASRCLEMAVDYAKQRVQFGRPIASFQAIKHKCADMMVQVESARSAVYYAACVVDEAGFGGNAELAQVAPLAKAYCSDAYFRCAADNIQIHGGVGFTWEYDCHLYFKRAQSSGTLLGDPAYHREQVARRIGL